MGGSDAGHGHVDVQALWLEVLQALHPRDDRAELRVAGRPGFGVLFRRPPDNSVAEFQCARFPARPPRETARLGAAVRLVGAVRCGRGLNDREGGMGAGGDGAGMAEHWMGYRRATNRRKLAGSGLA